MRKDRFQNKVATGSFTLPVASVLTTLLWCGEGIYTLDRLWGWLVCGLTAYVWVETNNTYSLIRIRSHLTPAIYLLMTGCVFSLHPLQKGLFIALLMIISYYLLFKSYQRSEAVNPIFHTFLSLSLGSLFFPQLLYFVPFYLWYTIVFLRSLTWKTFWAALVGVMLPYWFAAGYCLYTENFSLFTTHFQELAQFQLLSTENYLQFDFLQVSTIGVVVLFTFIASIHYIRTSFNDKIRTRMLLYIILIQELLILVFMALQPVHFQVLLGTLLMNSAPILSHYFALTHKRFTNAVFILFLFMLAALAILNLWTHWSVF